MDFEEWKVRRKMYDPGFQRRCIINSYQVDPLKYTCNVCSHLKDMIPTIVKCADEVVDRLKQAISDGGGQGEVLMKEQFSMYMLVTIGRVSCISHVRGLLILLTFN